MLLAALVHPLLGTEAVESELPPAGPTVGATDANRRNNGANDAARRNNLTRVCHPYRGSLNGQPREDPSMATVEQCEAQCRLDPACYGFVFSDSSGHVVDRGASAKCGLENNSNYGNGANLGNPSHTIDAPACCDACDQNAECWSFTWVPNGLAHDQTVSTSATRSVAGGGTCWLHPVVGTRAPQPGWVSGRASEPPPPPNTGVCQLLNPPPPGGSGVNSGSGSISGLCSDWPDDASPLSMDDAAAGCALPSPSGFCADSFP